MLLVRINQCRVQICGDAYVAHHPFRCSFKVLSSGFLASSVSLPSVTCQRIDEMATSFLPAKQGFPIYPGSTFRYQFQWLDDNGKTKTPHDLTGYTGSCKIEGDDESEILLTTTNGGVLFGDRVIQQPSNGLVEIYIADKKRSEGPIGTEEITWKTAFYTLYVIEPNPPNDKLPLMAGQFHVVRKPL